MNWSGRKPIWSPGKLKFISYFQRVPGPSQAWGSIIRPDKELCLTLALLVCAFPFLGNHGALAAEASRHADSKCQFQVEAWVQQPRDGSSPDGVKLSERGLRLLMSDQWHRMGLCFSLDEDEAGLFPWWQRGKWHIGYPGDSLWILPPHNTLQVGLSECFSWCPVKEHNFHLQQRYIDLLIFSCFNLL